ncbi:DUF2969 domain-containing protein [Lentilactobacillus laojiaonis]|uniref:DUF2969 domain-containing protein n=1 Tax=Lentilactobacillus laojiaonis TaxID=2883998 RepID=UPI001D09CD90|nr:DUF2969 domain-containing protein [Lentilactobacillus laojiaonis]UDM31750.1 DUF2969 domain-containing protein [Lentilactobacillus laojiaonis]
MSKAKKSIDVEIKEKKDSTGNLVNEVSISGNVIGSIAENNDKFDVKNTENGSYRVNTFDEGVQTLIKDFHLHH